MRPRPSQRMPPRGSQHVVTVHAVARMLKWSAARVHSVDDILRPVRAANRERLYSIDRVLYFVHAVVDSAP
jgi:hypothetical protein